MPPQNILNAPTRLMKSIGYGKDYQYDHDAQDDFSGDNYWPEEMQPQSFYAPTERGFEARIAERMAYWERLRAERRPKLRPASSATPTPTGQGHRVPVPRA